MYESQLLAYLPNKSTLLYLDLGVRKGLLLLFFFFLNKLILLFRRSTLTWSKITVNTFIMVLKMYIWNTCSFELPIYQIILNVSLFPQ